MCQREREGNKGVLFRDGVCVHMLMCVCVTVFRSVSECVYVCVCVQVVCMVDRENRE